MHLYLRANPPILKVAIDLYLGTHHHKVYMLLLQSGIIPYNRRYRPRLREYRVYQVLGNSDGKSPVVTRFCIILSVQNR